MELKALISALLIVVVLAVAARLRTQIIQARREEAEPLREVDEEFDDEGKEILDEEE